VTPLPVLGRLPLAPRHCGRCQRPFDADPELYFQTDWALCPSCAEILLPSRQRDRSYLRSHANHPAGASEPG
jgi:hypothetical protein